jgi:hypothetical protein
VIPKILAHHHSHSNAVDPAEPRLGDFDESVLRRCVVVVLDCDMAIVNDPNEFMLADKPPRNGDGVGFLPKVRSWTVYLLDNRLSCESCSPRCAVMCLLVYLPSGSWTLC